jgi:ribosome maturation factor RimP
VARDNVSLSLEAVVKQELDALGYDLVLLRRSGTRSRPVVEIRIDRRDGERVSVGDCVRASRAIEARADADASTAPLFGTGRYELQVSSPGDARRGMAVGAAGSQQVVGAPPRSAVDEHTGDGSRDGWVS